MPENVSPDNKPQNGQPNVVFVITDDQGYGDLGCHGNPVINTPCIDMLHDQSIRFTNFAVSPSCAPTRAALMTGKSEFKSNVTHTWEGAIKYCYGINIGGRKGWRLPTISELMTIVEPSNSDPATQANIFTNIQYGQAGDRNGYWTSTSKPGDDTKAIFVRFSDGILMYHDKVTDYYVRAVRAAE